MARSGPSSKPRTATTVTGSSAVEERELRLAVRRGDFVAVEQVNKEWIGLVSRARALLEARLLDEMPPVLSGKDAHGIRQELERVLTEFYELLHGGGASAGK